MAGGRMSGAAAVAFTSCCARRLLAGPSHPLPWLVASPATRQGYGTFESPDGARYAGNWQGNLKHGIGKKVYANGDAYEGLWRNGKAEGPGRWGAGCGGGSAGRLVQQAGWYSRLAGVWRIAVHQSRKCFDAAVGFSCCCPRPCLPAARRRYVWHNGNQYDGEWRGGKMHGQGTLKWITGAAGRRAGSREGGGRPLGHSWKSRVEGYMWWWVEGQLGSSWSFQHSCLVLPLTAACSSVARRPHLNLLLPPGSAPCRGAVRRGVGGGAGGGHRGVHLARRMHV